MGLSAVITVPEWTEDGPKPDSAVCESSDPMSWISVGMRRLPNIENLRKQCLSRYPLPTTSYVLTLCFNTVQALCCISLLRRLWIIRGLFTRPNSNMQHLLNCPMIRRVIATNTACCLFLLLMHSWQRLLWVNMWPFCATFPHFSQALQRCRHNWLFWGFNKMDQTHVHATAAVWQTPSP